MARGDTVVQVAQIDSTFMIGALNWVGIDVPPHCSSLGKVMYAFGALPLPKSELERRTPATLTDLADFKAEVDLVRERGFAITRGELEEGLDGIAAPVFGPDGHVMAALGVSGPAFRIEDSLTSIGDLVVAEARQLSRLLARRIRKESRNDS